MKKLFVIILFLVSSAVFADDNSTLIEKGNKAYNGKFYQQAIDCYLKVVKNGYEAAELYNNLGSAYFKLNDNSSAILYFEKANLLIIEFDFYVKKIFILQFISILVFNLNFDLFFK